ncbi:lef-2 [Hyphantria cunea granulovirus]|uniref:Lef-2 n=1 Tax=Hyphantria cunea granulovirus TaxID=307448 RepID=A0AAF1D263_9BBAC|nr:lef-2 [Hyphantria cunea granulovirus]QBQ01585.1 lef-2 [Hyphantria cunea granulovirus]
MESAVMFRKHVDPNQYYWVDVFSRDWSRFIDAYTQFAEGGLKFLVYGQNLQRMLKLCPPFDQEEQAAAANVVNLKRKDVCFKSLTTRTAVTEKYTELFYNYGRANNTFQDFKALCERPRTHRYANRLKFTYKIYKALRCSCCADLCVVNALKIFYKHDKKCCDEVNRLFFKTMME